jgi:hypothetical protein
MRKTIIFIVAFALLCSFMLPVKSEAAERHWLRVVNILLTKQMWVGQGQELYSYTMHETASGTTATWTYNHTTHTLMLSIVQTMKIIKGAHGKQWVTYKVSTVHLMDFKGDCTPSFAVFGDLVVTDKGKMQTLLTIPPAKITKGHKVAWNKWYAQILSEHGKNFKRKKSKES